MAELTYCKGCTGSCCTGTGSDPCVCQDDAEVSEASVALLLEAASTLRQVAPDMASSFRSLADPMAEWMEILASDLSLGVEASPRVLDVVLRTAREITRED